jgi:hypothetical protein
MKILYSWGSRDIKAVKVEIEEWRKAGYDVTSLNHREVAGVDYWGHIDIYKRVKNYEQDPDLLRLYNKVKELSEDHDILIVHYENPYSPHFIKSLTNIYTVIDSGDDPESSDYCSKPYVYAFDHAFSPIVNFNETAKITEKYIEWGAKRANWWPYGVREDMYEPALTEDDIYNKDRDVDLTFVGNSGLRLERLTKIKKAFPQMKMYGRRYWRTIGGSGTNALRRGNFPKDAFKAVLAGLWQIRKLPETELVPLYQRSKIGINIHLSFGAGNLRVFQLPANGVMQICDCPESLEEVFEIDKEVVLYHSIEEAVELIKYYLEHDDERKKIAAAGFKRVMKDYKRIITFSNAIEKIKKGMIEDGITHFKDGTSIKGDESE